jgi:hypothetical protein
VEAAAAEAKQSQVPPYVQERARALGLTGDVGLRRLVRTVREMSAAELEAVGKSHMDASHNHLDAELT